jgi:hypothetical protein
MTIKNLIQTGAVLLVVLGAPSAFALPAELHTDIVGGTNVQPGDPVAATTVMLYSQVSMNGNVGTGICSASLLTTGTLITAAHCVAEDLANPTSPQNIVIVFGQTLPNSVVFGQTLPSQINDPMVRPITNYVVAPGWQGTNNGEVAGVDAHDLALIHFAGGLPNGFTTATVLPAGTNLTAGEQTELAGYGITSSRDTNGTSAGTLREVVVTIEGPVGTTEMGVKTTTRAGMCSGDSGGPAFVNYNGQLALWGVTSRGGSGCTGEGIYTQIDAYLSWITQNF